MKTNLNVLMILESFTGLISDHVLHIVKYYSKKYKKYRIPKANGGLRLICHPARQLKMLQYALDMHIVQKLEISNICRGYVKNLKSPLRIMGEEHSNYKYTIRIDFKDFFPSLKPEDLFVILQNSYYLSEEDKYLLKNILFYYDYKEKSWQLPIGAPSSPSISNLIMKKMDEKFSKLAKIIDKNSTVSRYADDLYFSTNIPSRCKTFYDGVYNICSKSRNPQIIINCDKIAYLSTGTKRIICGVFITHNHRLSIGRERKMQIKKQLYKLLSGPLPLDEMQHIQGVMAFIKDVEPNFYNKLIIKYGIRYTNHLIH